MFNRRSSRHQESASVLVEEPPVPSEQSVQVAEPAPVIDPPWESASGPSGASAIDTIPRSDATSGAGPAEWLSGEVDRATVASQLYEVIDPEIGVNIVDLGLLYGLRVPDGQVLIQMTLTTPGCPLGGYIEDSIHRALWGMPGVEHINVDLVWEPPWGPELMSDQAKRELGWIA